ncbi:MAG: inverse autotransporter beta domain-containing protein, partial [Planctomycetota bacterium]
HLVFFDGRATDFDSDEEWEFNVGLGYRTAAANGAVLGLVGFYDERRTDAQDYRQLAFGAEYLLDDWEARGNVYLPLGDQRGEFFNSGLFNLRFVRNFIEADRVRGVETSLGGFDFEVGGELLRRRDPGCDETDDEASRWDFNPRGYLGGYHFSARDTRTVNGVRGRFEAFLSDRITVQGAVQHDVVFDTTVSGGVTFYLGGYGGGDRLRSARSKFGQRVVRDRAIVVSRELRRSSEFLIDPRDGEPVFVQHINSFSPDGGDGTVENPFNDLEDAEAASRVEEILFIHADSSFEGLDIALKDGQRLLGEGIDHSVTAQQGVFLLPRATDGTSLPELASSRPPSEATVTLANDTEVSGLQLIDAGDDADQLQAGHFRVVR